MRVCTCCINSGVGLAAYSSTDAKYFLISVLTADVYDLLRSRLRSAILTRLTADLILATVDPETALLVHEHFNSGQTTITSTRTRSRTRRKIRVKLIETTSKGSSGIGRTLSRHQLCLTLNFGRGSVRAVSFTNLLGRKPAIQRSLGKQLTAEHLAAS